MPRNRDADTFSAHHEQSTKRETKQEPDDYTEGVMQREEVVARVKAWKKAHPHLKRTAKDIKAAAGPKQDVFYTSSWHEETNLVRLLLRETLDGVKSLTGVVHHGIASTEVSPQIALTDGAPMSLPLSAADTAAIIAAARKAPYGKGAETVYDDAVRNTWQLEPGSVRVECAGWESTMRDMVHDVALNLGLEPRAITAEFYKCLVYEQGGHFSKHRDTEKGEGMIGSLIVTLPSVFTGGGLNVAHANTTTRFDLAAESGNRVHYVGFYSDCEHELLPVESGVRLCVVYNLMRRDFTPECEKQVEGRYTRTDEYGSTVSYSWGEKAKEPMQIDEGAPFRLRNITCKQFEPADVPAIDAKGQDLRAIMELWSYPLVPAQRVMMYKLEHEYSPDGLRENGLKGRDLEVAQFLYAARERSGGAFDFEAGLFRKKDSISGDSIKEPDYEGMEFSFQTCGVAQTLDATTFSVATADFDQNFLPMQTEIGKIDKKETERTGNEGTTYYRWYQRAFIWIWPTRSMMELSQGYDKDLGRVAVWSNTTDPVERALLEEIFPKTLQRASLDGDYAAPAVRAARLLNVPQLSSRLLTLLFIEKALLPRGATDEFTAPLEELLAVHGDEASLRMILGCKLLQDNSRTWGSKVIKSPAGQKASDDQPPAEHPSVALVKYIKERFPPTGARTEFLIALLGANWAFGDEAALNSGGALLLSQLLTDVPWSELEASVRRLAEGMRDKPSHLLMLCALLLKPDTSAEAWALALELTQSTLVPSRVHDRYLPVFCHALHRRFGDRALDVVGALISVYESAPRADTRISVDKIEEVTALMEAYMSVMRLLPDADARLVRFLTRDISNALSPLHSYGLSYCQRELAQWWIAQTAPLTLKPAQFIAPPEPVAASGYPRHETHLHKQLERGLANVVADEAREQANAAVRQAAELAKAQAKAQPKIPAKAPAKAAPQAQAKTTKKKAAGRA